MNASTGRGRLVAAFLAGAALLVAGCSTSNASAGSTTPGTTQASPAAAAPAPTPTPIAALPTCKSGVLSVLLKHAGAAHGGTASYRIVFMDLADVPCKLDGFPGVSFYGKKLAQIGSAAVRNQSSPEKPVEVVPEGTVIAMIQVVNASRYPSACRQTTVRGILVQPPGLTNSVQLPFSGLACANRRYHLLTVNAVVQGPPTENED